MSAPLVYELRKPRNLEPVHKYPAVFVMHGIGSNEQNMLSVIEGLDETFFVFSIRGPIPHGSGFAYFTIQGYGKPHREVFDGAVHNLTSFIAKACEDCPLDSGRLYVLGFSQGAILAMTLGLKLGNRVKGIIALSGYIPDFVKEATDSEPVDHVSVFISHGEYDQVLPFEWGQASAAFFRSRGAQVTFRSYPEVHTVSPDNLRDFQNWLLHELNV